MSSLPKLLDTSSGIANQPFVIKQEYYYKKKCRKYFIKDSNMLCRQIIKVSLNYDFVYVLIELQKIEMFYKFSKNVY